MGFKPSHEEEEEEEEEVFTTKKAKGEFFDPTLPMIELSSAEEPAPVRRAGSPNERRSAGSRARRRKAKRLLEPAASNTNARDAGAQGVDQAGSGQNGRKDGKGMAAAGRRIAVPAMEEEEEEVMEDEGRAWSGSWAEGSNVAAGLDAGALAGMFLSVPPPLFGRRLGSRCALMPACLALHVVVSLVSTRTHSHTHART